MEIEGQVIIIDMKDMLERSRWQKRNGSRVYCPFLYLMCSVDLLIVIWLYSAEISGNDFWWHVKTGEWIMQHGYIPVSDVFSWLSSSGGLAWTPHEWCAEIIFYVLYHFLGEAGIFICIVLIAMLLNFFSLLLWRREMERNNLFWGIYFIYSAFLTRLFCVGRPQIFSFCFLLAEVALLYRFIDNSESKGIYWIPLIAVFWSNFHGGSSNLSYFLVFMVLVCNCFSFSFGRLESKRFSTKSLMRLGIVFAATVLGIFVNPVGWKIFLYPYEQMGKDIMLKCISEWFAPDVKNLMQLCLLFGPVFLTVVSVILSEKKIRMVDFCFMLFFTYLFFRSVRFIAFYILVAPFWVSHYTVDNVSGRKKSSEKYQRLNFVFCMTVIILALAGTGVGVCEMYSNITGNTVISKVLTEEMLEIVKQENPKRLFNDYDYGGDLIFEGIPVFYDGRADIYVETDVFIEGNSLMQLRWIDNRDENFEPQELLKKYQFDGILINKERPFSVYLNSHPEQFEKVAERGTAVYYRVCPGTDI